jgi:hypothetical protein
VGDKERLLLRSSYAEIMHTERFQVGRTIARMQDQMTAMQLPTKGSMRDAYPFNREAIFAEEGVEKSWI